MNAGEVIKRWEQFPDGGSAQKYFISLNETTEKQPSIFVITTSRRNDWRVGESGCFHQHKGSYFIIRPNKLDFFPQLTFVQLHRAWAYTQMEILQEGLCKRNFESVGQISEQTLNAIINCFLKSDDIEGWQKAIVIAAQKSKRGSRITP